MNERVAAMVRAAIVKNPQVDNTELRRRAAEIDRGVRRLSPRQFHATYRLPALRSVASVASAPSAKPATTSSPKRDTQPGGAAAKPATQSTPTPAAKPATAAAPVPAPVPAVAPRSDTMPIPAEVPPQQLPAQSAAAEPSPTRSKALARPHAAEREAVRGILQSIVREALGTEDRASFVRLLDSLDERASVILGLFGRA
jgi:hypothetical protein